MKLGSIISSAGAFAIVVVVAACGEAPAQEDIGATSQDLTSLTRSQVLARGEEWVAAKVPYCQAANHQPDGDKACAATCTRPNNSEWDAYRSDCSGFVSWSWGLAAPGRTTATLAPAVNDISHAIDPKTLLPGDAVNKPSDHTMLFVKWVTQGTRATFMEEPGCSSAMPFARQIDSDVTISGMSITVKENGLTFSAIRFDAITDDPDAGTSTADAASHEDATTGATNADANAPPPPPADAGTTNDPPSAPASGGTPGSGGTTAPSTNDDANGSSSSSGGCAVSRSGGSDGGATILLACIAAIATRARRRIRARASR